MSKSKSFVMVAAGCFLLSASVLMIELTGHLVEHARADVQINGLVVGFDPSPDNSLNARLLLADGTSVELDGAIPGWYSEPWDERLPIAIADIKFWARYHLVSRSDEVWVKNTSDQWISVGTPPGGPVSDSGESMGFIKKVYRGAAH